jgi:hypothetical protein
MVNRSCSLGPLRSITGSDASTSRAASGARTRVVPVRCQGCPPRCPGGRPPITSCRGPKAPVRQPSHFFWLPSPAARPGAGGDGGALQGGTSSGPWAVRQMPLMNDVRCAVRQPGRRRRPGRPGCAAAPACRTFLRRFAASLVDHGSRCAESGENARRTQKGASDSDAGLPRDAASKAHAGFVER